MPAKYEKSAPYSIGAIAKTKCGSGGAGGLASPIYKTSVPSGMLNYQKLQDYRIDEKLKPSG